MHLILKVHHSDHGSEAQSEYAHVNLTSHYARVLLNRQQAFQLARQLGSMLYRLTYWDTCDWLGGLTCLREGIVYPESWHVEDYGDATEAFLRQHLTEKELNNLNHGCGPQVLPATFLVPEYLLDSTELGMIDVTDHDVLFKSYPRHGDCQQETDSIPWDLILQAAQTRDAEASAPSVATQIPVAAVASLSPAS